MKYALPLKQRSLRFIFIFLCIPAFLYGFAIPKVEATNTNILADPGFESNTLPGTWDYSISGTAAGTATLDNSGAHSGTYDFNGNVTSSSTTHNQFQVYQQNINILAGQSYSFSFYAKASATRNIDFQLEENGGAFTSFMNVTGTALTTSWAQYTATMSPNVGFSNCILLFYIAASTGHVWIDDVSLSPNAPTEPVSTSYSLLDYGFGSGGVNTSHSGSLYMDGNTGNLSNGSLSTNGTTKMGAGLEFEQQYGQPPAATIVNSSSWYNKLHITINTPTGATTDEKYIIQTSTDNFVTDIEYFHADGTRSTVFTRSTDAQTYISWGGASGQDMTGLLSNTTYYVRVATSSANGLFIQSTYGAVASAATVNPSFSLAITTDTLSSPPFSLSFGSLLPGSVTATTTKAQAHIDTNGMQGGSVYINGVNAGLYSSTKSYTIASLTGDLSSLSTGYGAQSASVTQTTGGPLSAVSPYNGSTNNVGIVDTTLRQLYSSSSQITGGVGSFQLLAKVSTIVPSSPDYTETLTIIGAGNF